MITNKSSVNFVAVAVAALAKISVISFASILACQNVAAFSFEAGNFSGTLNSAISVGATFSTETADRALIGKLNIDGQQDFCDPGQPVDLLGLPAAVPDPLGACALAGFERFYNAPGSFLGHGFDDGRLNYDKGDVVAAAAKITSDLVVTYEDFTFVAKAIIVSDPVNTDFTEKHVNNFDNGGAQPARTPRKKSAEDSAYQVAQLETFYFEALTEYFDRLQIIRVGKQLVRWGESLLLIPNSLNTINAPDLVRLNTPGRELNEILDPTNQIYLNTGITDALSMQATYLLDWQPVRLDPAGSFLSPADLLGAGSRNAVSLGLGYSREDPSNLLDTNFLAGVDPDQFGRDCFAFRDGTDDGVQGDQFSNLNQGAHRGATIAATDYAGRPGLRPDDAEFALDFTGGRQACFTDRKLASRQGQWGVGFNLFTDILGGAEFGLYYLNYHSRFPYLSAYASQLPTAITDLTAITDILEGVPIVGDAIGTVLDAVPTEALQVLGALKVADTVRLQEQYPENIEMYGFSMSTNIGDYSIAGEFAYRPDLPLQVHPVDLLFYALSPAFGRLRCLSTPSYLDIYRSDYDQYTPFSTGECPDQSAAPGEFLPGFESFPVGQGDIVGISIAETNPFLADSWIRVLEVGFTKVFGLPDVDELQISGGQAQTSAFPGRGQLDSDFDGVRDDDGAADAGTDALLAFLVLNPDQQDTKVFATSFSWGYRFVNILTYEQVFKGTLELTVGLFHDVNGTSPGPGGNFIEDRKQFLFSPSFQRGSWKFGSSYVWNTGAGIRNNTRDRDTFSLSVTTTF